AGVGVMRAHGTFQRTDVRSEHGETATRIEFAVFGDGFDQDGLATVLEDAAQQRERRLVRRVETEVADGVVEAAVVVEVRGGKTVPPAAPGSSETGGFGMIREALAFVITEEEHRAPVAGQ